jgi:KUP system potassium uptake protein
VLHGGWFPLAIALVIFVVLTTWQRGREIVTQKREELEGPLADFVEEIRNPEQPITRSPRTGIFLDANPETTPLALRANVDHNCVLHENVVIVSVQTLNVPHVGEAERVTVDDLGYRDDGITHVTARFGFQDDLDVPAALRSAAKRLEREADFDHVSYFLSRISIIATDEPGMAMWRKKLFIAIARNSASPVPYFHLPDERTVVMASHVEL